MNVSESRAVYVIMLGNMGQPERPQKGAEKMRFACRIDKVRIQAH
jgi:hypothetical protein